MGGVTCFPLPAGVQTPLAEFICTHTPPVRHISLRVLDAIGVDLRKQRAGAYLVEDAQNPARARRQRGLRSGTHLPLVSAVGAFVSRQQRIVHRAQCATTSDIGEQRYQLLAFFFGDSILARTKFLRVQNTVDNTSLSLSSTRRVRTQSTQGDRKVVSVLCIVGLRRSVGAVATRIHHLGSSHVAVSRVVLMGRRRCWDDVESCRQAQERELLAVALAPELVTHSTVAGAEWLRW